MSAKERLHSLIELLPDEEVGKAETVLEQLCYSAGDPMLRSLLEAPEDDEPLASQEANASEQAWRDYLNGRDPGKSLEQLNRELLDE